MRILKHTITLVSLCMSLMIYAQEEPFNVVLEPMNIEDLGGIQSFAYGQSEGK